MNPDKNILKRERTMKPKLWWMLRLRGLTRTCTAMQAAAGAWEAEQERRRRAGATDNNSPACKSMTIRTPEEFWGFPGP